MKFLFDIFPILLFFIAFKFFGIYTATAIAIAASFLQILYMWLSGKKIQYTLWINVLIIGIFGGLTLLLHNEIFIKWKPTILYGIFAAALIVADLLFKKNLVRSMVGTAVDLPERAWITMNYSWVIFFALLAVLNLIVAYSVSTEAWVNFKLFGLIGLTVLFVVLQSVWLSRYISSDKV